MPTPPPRPNPDAITSESGVPERDFRRPTKVPLAGTGPSLFGTSELDQLEFIDPDRMDALARMAGGTAHYLNNLLTVIQGNAVSLRSRLHDVETREELDEILDGCLEVADFASQMLAISGRQWAHPREVDVREVISGMALGRFLAGEVIYCSNFHPEPCRAAVDPEHLEMVVRQLFRNAVDAVDGSGFIEVGVRHLPVHTLDGTDSPGWVQVEVADSGRGMADDVRSHAFAPFFTTRDHPKVAGLGLAVVHGLVRRMKGEIAIETEPGRGTRVIFWIPGHRGSPQR